jgi:transglutaminase-like putative cysteine protease
MIKSIITGCFLLIFVRTYGEDPKYPVASIAEELKKNANAVVREDRMTYTIISRSKGKLQAYSVVTIFNSKGKHFAEFTLGYNKLTKITQINANVYDASGNRTKKLKNNEIADQSYSDGTMFRDLRLKSIDLAQTDYPYTVEIEYEIEYNFLYHIDGSTIIPGENVSVEHASYELIFPDGLKPRYKTFNISNEPEQQKTAEGLQSLLWKFQNLPALKLEDYAPSHSFLPAIMAAPSEFEYSGYVGDMSTWEQYGRWQLQLNKDRDILPEETKVRIRELTKDLKTTEEKTKALYEYMQSKTRYVYIGLGIGGLQPFEASVVDKMGYGDCKGLSNYMVSMLKEVGIKGYYTTVYAGENPPAFIPEFPSHQANHVIVAVPNNADTLWLECTDQTIPFGYIGRFTEDRKALMITDEGGKVVNTKKYSIEQNLKSRSADVFVQPNGDAKATVKTIYSGLQYEDHHLDYMLNNQYDMQKKWVQNTTNIPMFDLVTFSMKNNKGKIPSATVTTEFNLQRFATVNGKRIFLTPNLMNRSTYIPEKTEQRKSIILVKIAYTDHDTIRYHIPEGIYPEFLPEPFKISSRFGTYESVVKLDAGSLVYIRKVKMKNGEFPPESYNEMVDFYKAINKADNMKLVFLNKT